MAYIIKCFLLCVTLTIQYILYCEFEALLLLFKLFKTSALVGLLLSICSVPFSVNTFHLCVAPTEVLPLVSFDVSVALAF